LKVLFVSDTKLNGDNFIIDHQLFDDAIQKVQVNSCEIMSKEILDSIENVLKKNKLKCLGIKLQIQPAFVVPENSAYFQEHRCANRTNLALIVSL
jgi:hypothetical protein